jgi:hypothetical protein
MARRDAAGLIWNERAGRYQTRPGGPFLSRVQVRDALDRATDAAGRRMQALTDQLRDRSISLAEWQTQMRLSLRDVHAYSAAVAQGGLAQMGPTQWGLVGRQLRDQYERLSALAVDIDAGRVPVDGRLRARARLYGLSGRATYEAAALRDLAARGFDEERNVRRAGDTCDGCLDASAAGWQPIGVIPAPGTRTCLGNCRCFLRRRNSRTGEIAA